MENHMWMRVIRVISEGIRKIPVLRYAFGLAVIAACLQLAIRFAGGSKKLLIIGIPATIVVMILLYLVARLVALNVRVVLLPIQVMVWATTIAFVIALGAGLSAMIFKVPRPLYDFMFPPPVNAQSGSATTSKNQAGTHQLPNQAEASAPKPISADAIIAEFDAHNANQRVEVARRLQSDLQAKLHQYGLDEITVAVLPDPILTDTEALTKASGRKIFIWGWYDNFGVSVHILAAEGGRSSDSSEYPWTLGTDSQQASFTVRTLLPENVSFISLFVIGDLYYSSNNYAKGQLAFDAAMRNMPKSLGGKDQSAFYFFRARQESGINDKDAICDYARALKLNPDMAMAYNNLAVLWARNGRFREESLSKRKKCVSDAEEFADEGFEKALRLKPKVALFRFNILSRQWLEHVDKDEGGLSEKGFEQRLLSIVKADNSIPGAYALLGVLAFDRDDSKRATLYFDKAVKLSPSSPEFRFNLAQSLILKDYYTQAKNELQHVVSVAPQNGEAYLELANLSLWDNNSSEASHYLTLAAERTTSLDNFADLVAILKSQVAFQQNHYNWAAQKLIALANEDHMYLTSPDLLHYTASLLLKIAGSQAAAVLEARKALSERCCPPEHVYDDQLKEFFGLKTSQSLKLEDITPRRAKNFIQLFYSAFQAEIPKRIFHRIREAAGRCPCVFTFDPAQYAWKYDTTVLYDLIGPQREATQARRLTRFDGRLLIREVEPETSYIASIYILVTDRAGRQFKLQPQTKIGATGLVLHQGEEVLLSFGDLPFQEKPATINVVTRGYYVPHQHRR